MGQEQKQREASRYWGEDGGGQRGLGPAPAGSAPGLNVACEGRKNKADPRAFGLSNWKENSHVFSLISSCGQNSKGACLLDCTGQCGGSS